MFPNKIVTKRVTKHEDGILILDEVQVRVYSPNGNDLKEIYVIATKDIPVLCEVLQKIV